MIKQITLWLLLIALGIGCGLCAALMLTRTEYFGNRRIEYGPWSIARENTMTDDPLMIARLAVFGPFPVKQSEVMYLTALKDSAGRPLKADQNYSVCGKKFDARFWSLTAYDQNGMFFPNQDQRFSYNFKTVKFDGDQFCLQTGPLRQSENWLPTQGNGGMRLTIRFYQPSQFLRDSLSAQVLPTIKMIGGAQ